MRTSILKQNFNDSIDDFEFALNRLCLKIEKDNKNIVDIQVLMQNNLLIAVIKHN